jgi:hypothetical protein
MFINDFSVRLIIGGSEHFFQPCKVALSLIAEIVEVTGYGWKN